MPHHITSSHCCLRKAYLAARASQNQEAFYREPWHELQCKLYDEAFLSIVYSWNYTVRYCLEEHLVKRYNDDHKRLFQKAKLRRECNTMVRPIFEARTGFA